MADQDTHLKYDVMKLSDYIIKYFLDHNKSINNLRLNGTLYFVQAYFLMQTGTVVFIDELEARDYGPVVAKVYSKYSEFGIDPIPRPSADAEVIDLTLYDKGILNEVLEFTFPWSNATMSNLIHDQRPYRHARDSHSKIIPPEKLRKYFS